MRRADLLLAVAAVLGALLFFPTLPRTWPLLDVDLTLDASVEDRARRVLADRGLDAPDLHAATRLDLADGALAYVEATFGRDRARELARAPTGLVTWEVLLVRAGDPVRRRVRLHPDGTLVGFSVDVEEDTPGPSLPPEAARALAVDALRDALGVDVASWRERAGGARARSDRTDHTFAWDRMVSTDPELRETVNARVAGDVVVDVGRNLVVPAAGRRAAVAAAAVPGLLGALGKLGVAVTAILACAVFVRRLRDGAVDLGTPARWTLALFLGHLVIEALDGFGLLAGWQPLWPRWISTLKHGLEDQVELAWAWLVLFVVIAAAARVDRGRASTLWDLGRGRLTRPVGADLVRGFALGLACGGLFSAFVLGVEAIGGRVALQPRGVLLDVIDRDLPTLAAFLWVLRVALVEELGYRVFGGSWLLERTGRPWVAVLVPALVYGLSHADLAFLPPSEPAWGRAVGLTLVGAVWGVAYLRWGALVVVVSHLTADVFLFSWPRIPSGDAVTVGVALAVFLAPLLLGITGLLRGAPGAVGSRRSEAA